jgi:hypothetical protein
MSEIYENKYDQKSSFVSARDEVNTKEQQEKADFYTGRYNFLKSEMQDDIDEWESIEKLYCIERDKKNEDDINSFDPIILPVVEGQVSSMTEKYISASIKGEGYSDQKFAHTGQILTDFGYRNIGIKQKVKDAIRRYILFGNGCLALGWDADALDGFGLPDLRCPQISKIFVDGKIKNISDVQKAEYIIEEIGSFSILSARKEYGDEIADAITLGNTNPDFDGSLTNDDRYSFTKLHIWTRNNDEGNLQLIELSLCGVLLRESDPKEPYYSEVNNLYPYFFFGLYPREGKFHRFGDGKILERLQVLINNLWDECVIACKFSAQGMTFVDPNAGCDPDQFDGDPSHPIMVREPSTNVKTSQGQGLNNIVISMINMILNEVQRITRFSVLMSGNAPNREITATQSGIMMQQGNSGIDDKRNDVSTAISNMTLYMLGLMMEFWPAAKAIRITEDSDEIEWVDARQLKNIPAMIPVDSNYEKQWKVMHPDKPVPQYMQLESDKNGPQTKKAVFDVTVSIGEGLPTSKMALYSIILGLSKIQLPDENTGMPRPLLTFQQVQSMVQDIIGIPLKEAQKEAQNIMGQMGISNVIPQNQNIAIVEQSQQTGGNPYIDGSAASGMMSNQPMEAGA